MHTGGCLCGEITYTLNADPKLCVACHCKNCQRQSGSALSIIVGVSEGDLDIRGEVKTYDDTGDSGKTVMRQFCRNCGSPVFTRLEGSDDLMFIKAGTLDDTSSLKPAFHCYTKSKQQWIDISDIPGFETVPEGL
ncbi:GFA family protein [Erythrobacter sp. MTPC3]|uniref:GFA family protein n=1 Tax=Erythrobacter sp. MTPC3 TaxID=3056564 RepID=UPI0036F362A9